MTKGLGVKQREALAVLDHRWKSTIAVAQEMGINDEIGIRSVRRALDQLHTKRGIIDKDLSSENGTIEARWRIMTDDFVPPDIGLYTPVLIETPDGRKFRSTFGDIVRMYNGDQVILTEIDQVVRFRYPPD